MTPSQEPFTMLSFLGQYEYQRLPAVSGVDAVPVISQPMPTSMFLGLEIVYGLSFGNWISTSLVSPNCALQILAMKLVELTRTSCGKISRSCMLDFD